MAHWFINNKDATLILTPKVCSSSFRSDLNDYLSITKKGKRTGICLREPLDRAASVIAAKNTMQNIGSHYLKDMATGNVHNHLAPQVDFIKWRYNGNFRSTGTNSNIKVGASDIGFEPDFVFFYEDMNLKELGDFLGIKIKRLSKKNAHRGRKPYREVLGNNLEFFTKFMERDLAFYERMRQQHG